MKKHYETHVEDTDKLISVAGPVLDYKSWYEQYRKLMEEQAQRKYGLYTPTSEGDDDFPSITGMIARYSALGLTNEQMAANPVWVDKTGNGHDLQMKNFAWKEGSGISDIYPGAIVFDGVDDYGTCDNFPILTKEKGYTVVALRRWLSLYEDNKYYTLLVNSNQRDKGAFAFEEFNNRSKGTFNFGKYVAFSSVNLSMPFTYQTSTSYNGKAIAIGGLKEGVNLFQVCKIGTNYCSKAAIWEIVILDHDATEEELTKIKDYFVKTYPWLFPDQAWTVVGKTNEDEDRATIANITGNGNDLILSNFEFAEGSGYNEQGEYAGYLVTDGVDDEIISAKLIQFADKFTIVGDWKFMEDRNDNAGLLKANQIYIYNATTGMRIYLKQGSKNYPFSCKKINALTSDGWVYDEKWDKYKVYPIGSDIDISSRLFLGFYGSNFTKIALKNLGIYNDQLLSKDDCIKAYNYLQTLKAK